MENESLKRVMETSEDNQQKAKQEIKATSK